MVAPRVLLAAGLRGDRVTTENRGGYFGDRTTSHGAGSGYASATVGSFRGFTLTGQVARGFRDPVLSDRYFRGPSGRGFITGNPDLEPETSIQFDSALRYTTGRYRYAVYAFHYRIDDLIERYQTTTDFFFFRNRGRAQMRGVEFEAQAELGTGWSLALAAQLTRGKALDDDAPLDGVPSSSMSLQVRKQVAGRGFIQARGAAYDRDERPGPTERVTPGYAVLDLGAGWKVTRELELSLTGRNLLDQEYLVSPDTRTVFAPGRSVLLTATVRVGGRP
jgi:outer membrane receptor for ferrienterochelin and colicins